MTLAPIVLFAFNRPDHLLLTLEALQSNKLADESKLYIYCDGPKPHFTNTDIDKINQVRDVAKKEKWCKEIVVIERDRNYGLAESVVAGVTEVVQKYGQVIVLEDDIVTSPGFLTYMNDALRIYSKEERVMHVAGYFYPISVTPEHHSFFLPLGTCWGWATWADAWNKYNHSAKELLSTITALPQSKQKQFDNQNNSIRLLKRASTGQSDSWAIRWYASIFLADGLGLHPYKSLIRNIGFDGSGTNYFSLNKIQSQTIAKLDIDYTPINKATKIEKALKSYFFWERVKSAPFYYINMLKNLISH